MLERKLLLKAIYDELQRAIEARVGRFLIGNRLNLAAPTVGTLPPTAGGTGGTSGVTIRGASDYDNSAAPADGQAVTWSAASGKFHPVTPAAPGMANPMTTPGDLIVGGTGGTPGRLGLGTAGAYLQVSGGQPVWGPATGGGGGGGLTIAEADGTPSVSGVTSITVSNGTLTDNGSGSVTLTTGGGGGGAWTQISKQTVSNGGSGVASIDFTSIPGTYNDLAISLVGRGLASALTTDLLVRFNGDSGAHYAWESFVAFGASNTGVGGANGDTAIHAATIPAASAPSGYAGPAALRVGQYAQAQWTKQLLADDYDSWDSTTGRGRRIYGGIWTTTATAITRVTLSLSSGNFADNTVAILWGIT